MGKVIYGNENLGYAPIINNDGVYSFGTPVMLKGMVSSSAEIEDSDQVVYADNEAYCTLSGNKVTNLTNVLKYIPESYSLYLGFKQESNGMLVDTGKKPEHCIFFESTEYDCETGEETKTLHYFYNVKAKQPNESTNTTGEEIESVDLSVEYTAKRSKFVLDSEGKRVSYGKITRTEANKSLYDSFTENVILPTSSI